MGNKGSSSISRCKRDLPPADYMMKIQSYSMLTGQGFKFDSGLFESGGHKWKLSLYPKGKGNSMNNYISLYLAIEETDTYPNGWEVFANFKLFVYDQMRDNYLTIQDTSATVNRFSEMKKEWGFSELVSLETFNNCRHGYLFDDCCVFGAEVCVINRSHKLESLSIVKPVNDIFTWKLEKFSTLQNNVYESNVFTIGERNWTLKVYPKGESGDGLWLSVFLHLVDDGQGIPPILTNFKLQILDIVRDKKKDENSGERWFSAGGLDWGFTEFIELNDLNEFIVNDTLTIEVQFLTLSPLKDQHRVVAVNYRWAMVRQRSVDALIVLGDWLGSFVRGMGKFACNVEKFVHRMAQFGQAMEQIGIGMQEIAEGVGMLKDCTNPERKGRWERLAGCNCLYLQSKGCGKGCRKGLAGCNCLCLHSIGCGKGCGKACRLHVGIDVIQHKLLQT